MPQPDLPRGEQAGRAVEEADVEVGLRSGRHLSGVVGPVKPNRVDLSQPAEGGADREHDEEEATGLGRVCGVHPLAADRRLGLARAGELGVLLLDQQAHVGADQAGQDSRH